MINLEAGGAIEFSILPVEFFRRDARVVAAEAERIVDDDVHLHLARGVRHVVQIAFGSGFCKLMVGGTTPCLMASAQTVISTAPAAPSMWPVAPLVELTATFFAWLAENGLDGLRFADVALRRGGAVGVDVGNVGRDSAAGGARPFSCSAPRLRRRGTAR
jgi:hypothetical protein